MRPSTRPLNQIMPTLIYRGGCTSIRSIIALSLSSFNVLGRNPCDTRRRRHRRCLRPRLPSHEGRPLQIHRHLGRAGTGGHDEEVRGCLWSSLHTLPTTFGHGKVGKEILRIKSILPSPHLHSSQIPALGPAAGNSTQSRTAFRPATMDTF